MPLRVPPPGRERLSVLLAERNQNPDSVKRIDREIAATFGRRIAILALDMCDFTATTQRRGIIHYLAMIEEMARAATPAVEANHGVLIKQEADNLFAAFESPQAALEAALDIFIAFEAVNTVVPDERDLYGSIGIGYGDIILVGREDMFGGEVNLACKLGEDLAQRHEILVTSAAHVALPPGRYRFSRRCYRVSGVEIEAFRFEERLAEAPAA
ncbi:MAG TPA: adenylate/guanylate cyclase domain-containing protein [Beijerinckiaceae bacterium]|jgi:class 3 adenylate cyclase|nr:putative adenylate/guanylate cyclase [Microvirga sp.]HZB36982.1 adenylate/guanylate cyclase domain-containing protein [Beijerinckiaceae bacterium]